MTKNRDDLPLFLAIPNAINIMTRRAAATHIGMGEAPRKSLQSHWQEILSAILLQHNHLMSEQFPIHCYDGQGAPYYYACTTYNLTETY